jgi:hypothetical protein
VHLRGQRRGDDIDFRILGVTDFGTKVLTCFEDFPSVRVRICGNVFDSAIAFQSRDMSEKS